MHVADEIPHHIHLLIPRHHALLTGRRRLPLAGTRTEQLSAQEEKPRFTGRDAADGGACSGRNALQKGAA